VVRRPDDQKSVGLAGPLDIPRPDSVHELFHDEIVVREAEIDGEYREIAEVQVGVAWDNPLLGV